MIHPTILLAEKLALNSQDMTQLTNTLVKSRALLAIGTKPVKGKVFESEQLLSNKDQTLLCVQHVAKEGIAENFSDNLTFYDLDAMKYSRVALDDTGFDELAIDVRELKSLKGFNANIDTILSEHIEKLDAADKARNFQREKINKQAKKNSLFGKMV